MRVMDTSKIEFEWRLIEPDGSEAMYPGFYAACEELLASPGIGQLLYEAMNVDGVYTNKNYSQMDWMFDNAESFVADHGYSLEQVRKI